MRFIKTVESIFDIPSGFQRVAYLESTGTQYIDTGIAPSSITPIAKLKFIPTQQYSSGSYGIFGCFGANNTRFQVFYNSIGIGTYISKSWQANTTYEVELNGKTPSATINGTVETSGYSNANGFSSDNMYLFTRNNGGTADNGVPLKLYSCKIWDGDTLIRDFIPCIDPLGHACLYDLVGKKPYYNQGTGEFTVGRQIIPVEYLESTGTQYIDTGVIATQNTKILTKVYPTAINKFIFGSRTSTNVGAFSLFVHSNNGGSWYPFFGDAKTMISGFAINNDYIIELSNDGLVVNGNLLQGPYDNTFTGTDSIKLFALDTAGTLDSRLFIGKMYYSKLYESGVLIRDMIPAIDENNVGFMFDTISGTVYENAGTGAFAFGNNKYKTKLRMIRDNTVPTGYTQVEYLESSGTQWIDTGINPENANTKQVDIETNFTILTPGADQYIGIFGAAVPRFGFYTRYNNMCFGYSAAFDNLYEIEYGKKYNLRFSVTKGSQNATLDGVTVWSETRTGTLQNIYTIGLFCRNYSTPQWINNARIYNLTIAIDDVLVRDYIPAIDPLGVPCMYDKISKTPFYNQGTGTFVTGKPTLPRVRFIKDIVPREYAVVNYIESTGEQYIDTGFKGNTITTRYETKIVPTDVTTTQALFGSRNTANISNNNNCEMFIYQSQFRLDWIDGTVGSFVPISVGTPYELNITRGLGTINGVEYTSTQSSYIDQTYNFLIGNFTNGSSTPYSIGFIGKIYYSRLYSNNVLIHNFLPVLRKSDNKPGMLDIITMQFFTNAGTGEFLYG